MRLLQPEQMAALRAPGGGAASRVEGLGDFSIGEVFCLYRHAECVPIRHPDHCFMLEFAIPYFLTQASPYDDILLKTVSGGRFIPKLEHRFLSIGRVETTGEVINLCEVSPKDWPKDTDGFAQAIRQALLTYYRSYPSANQYFYLYDTPVVKSLLDVIFGRMPEAITERYEITPYPELAEPCSGFSLTSKRL